MLYKEITSTDGFLTYHYRNKKMKKLIIFFPQGSTFLNVCFCTVTTSAHINA